MLLVKTLAAATAAAQPVILVEAPWSTAASRSGLLGIGAARPTGNRYGDPAGHTCIAVAGPTERAVTLWTGHGDRQANMHDFTARA